jgi:hypothetical protein
MKQEKGEGAWSVVGTEAVAHEYHQVEVHVSGVVSMWFHTVIVFIPVQAGLKRTFFFSCYFTVMENSHPMLIFCELVYVLLRKYHSLGEQPASGSRNHLFSPCSHALGRSTEL